MHFFCIDDMTISQQAQIKAISFHFEMTTQCVGLLKTWFDVVGKSLVLFYLDHLL